MSDATIPAAAIEAGADALMSESIDSTGRVLASRAPYRRSARAVLEAATVEIDCPNMAIVGYDGEMEHVEDCEVCGGVGSIRILRKDRK